MITADLAGERELNFLKLRTNRQTYWACIGLLVCWVLFSTFVLHKYKGSISEVVVAMICVPRVHDIGKSGWVVAGVLAAYFAAAIGIAWYFDLDDAMIGIGIVAVVMTVLVVFLGVLPGEKESNRFGEPPGPGLHLWKRQAEAPPKA